MHTFILGFVIGFVSASALIKLFWGKTEAAYEKDKQYVADEISKLKLKL